jgi:hypothetical protein
MIFVDVLAVPFQLFPFVSSVEWPDKGEVHVVYIHTYSYIDSAWGGKERVSGWFKKKHLTLSKFIILHVIMVIDLYCCHSPEQ